MTLTKRKLKKMVESMWAMFTDEQERLILERFNVEPWPYEWSEQDIATQIQNFLACGVFIKPILNHGKQPEILPAEIFLLLQIIILLGLTRNTADGNPKV